MPKDISKLTSNQQTHYITTIHCHPQDLIPEISQIITNLHYKSRHITNFSYKLINKNTYQLSFTLKPITNKIDDNHFEKFQEILCQVTPTIKTHNLKTFAKITTHKAISNLKSYILHSPNLTNYIGTLTELETTNYHQLVNKFNHKIGPQQTEIVKYLINQNHDFAKNLVCFFISFELTKQSDNQISNQEIDKLYQEML